MTPTEPYVLKWPSGRFVARDATNGDYPIKATGLADIATFLSPIAADRYRQAKAANEDLTIHKIAGLETAPVTEHAQDIAGHSATTFTDPDRITTFTAW
jgi:hypothetical protein